MPYEFAFEDEIKYQAMIHWSQHYNMERVLNYDSEIPEDETANFYMWVGTYRHIIKLFYIGMTHRQYVSDRQIQHDHIERREIIEDDFPNYNLNISFGTLDLGDLNITKPRIRKIEKLLIYSNWNDDMCNSNDTVTCNVRDQVSIINDGNYKPLHRRIGFGVFIG